MDNDVTGTRDYPVSMVVRIGPKKPRQRAYLREHREAAGWSQTELANRMGTTKATISRYETGKRDYPGGFLAAVAEAMGKTEGDLFALPRPDAPPAPESLDALLAGEPEGIKKQALAVVRALLKTGT